MKKTVRILTYIVAAMMILAAWGGAATADDLKKNPESDIIWIR